MMAFWRRWKARHIQPPTDDAMKAELVDYLAGGFGAMESAADGLWWWVLETDHEYMSPRFWTSLGYDPAVMPHRVSSWMGLIHPDDGAEAYALYQAKLKDPAVKYDIKVRYRRGPLSPGGEWVRVRCMGEFSYSRNGRPIRMLGRHTLIGDTHVC